MVDSSETAGVHLQITGQNVNANAVRATALSLGGHISDVREVFDIVKGGQISTIKAESPGQGLGRICRRSNAGALTEKWQRAPSSIPTVNLDLTDVFGHAIIENGILTAENIRANYRKTHEPARFTENRTGG